MDQQEALQRLRDFEANFLSSPPPPDPEQTFPKGWRRAESVRLEDVTERQPLHLPPMPPPRRPRYERYQPRPRAIIPPHRVENEHRIDPPAINFHRRPISPSQLPGVRAIPKQFGQALQPILRPQDYFVKSLTRYLGPYNRVPTRDMVPPGDEYIVLQRMGRLPDSGKSIFRQVGTLST